MAGDSTLSIDDGWLDVAGAKLEYRRWRPVGVSSHGSAWVLLHEGLGCVETWRDFPAALARHSRSDVYAYSRAGYGRSSTIALPRRVDFMEREALDVLPEVLRGLGLDSPHLLGHSDGGTIALLAAAQGTVPFATVTALAAHVFNEPMCKAAIENTGNMFAQGPLREAL
nr:alpha/beta hydrolase [Gammaproteobacteria bacterium]